jgi:octaprenyl-diphosphate synthase
MDIAWHLEFTSRPSPEEYIQMCRLKTGALARLAAVLGVYAGSAGNEGSAGKADLAESAEVRASALAETLGEAAEKLGVGFQILDDVKNLTTGIPGKKQGDDIVEGKKSLPVLLYLSRRPEAGELTARCFAAARAGGTGVPEVKELIGALDASGVLEEAEKQGRTLIAEAREVFTALPDVPLAGGDKVRSLEARTLLADFTNLII